MSYWLEEEVVFELAKFSMGWQKAWFVLLNPMTELAQFGPWYSK